jgi:hypothetical protein
VDPPAGRCPQVFVVIAQMPDQIGDLTFADRPVVGDTGDPAQRVVGAVAGCIHFADDRMLGAGHRGRVGQRCHRGPDTVAAVVPAHRLQRPGRLGQPQFCCAGE